MSKSNRPARRLQTVEKMFKVVEFVKSNEGSTITELADHLSLAPSTIHGYVSTLTNLGYLVEDENQYHVGLRFLSLGGYAANRKPEYRFAKEKVNQIAEATGERAQFIVEENGRGTYLHTNKGQNAVQNAHIGKYRYLHNSAAGKAILAALPRDRVDAILDRWGLPAITEYTITDRETLLESLDEIRTQGYAVNNQESVVGLRAIGAAVKSGPNETLGALSISGPQRRLGDEKIHQELATMLKGAINELELNIRYE